MNLEANRKHFADREYVADQGKIARLEKALRDREEKIKALQWELREHNRLSRISIADKNNLINKES